MSLIAFRLRSYRRRRDGFTLIEALIAITMTLIIMLALSQAFKTLSYDISQGRARLALSDQLRGVSEVLRNDLSGLTVQVDPMSQSAKSGYFLYYEGPIADHHPVTVPINNLLGVPGATVEQNLSTSKYGDFDDILMFTARAKGDWFRGKVPLAIVKGAAAGGVYGSYSPTDWTTSVVVASEYAEIAYFMMPAVVPTLNVAPAPYEEYVVNANLALPIVDNDQPVNPTATMPASFTATGNAIPDRFSLCRRVLLILPNLNLPSGQLFNADPSSTISAASRLQSNPISTSPGSRLMLANAYQRCDLSVRRVPFVSTGFAPIAANSLEELANPINRFAHVTLPGPVLGAAAINRSMPILSLTGPLALQQYALGTNISLPMRSDTTFPECGFLRPEFLKRTFDPATGLVETVESPVTGADVELLSNEEVLASNCVAFDLKGYDPIARLLYNNGADLAPGAVLVDDDADGTVDNLSELGWSGTDDLVLSPSDPGYASSLAYIANATPPYTAAQLSALTAITSSQGCFVDIGWSAKTLLSPVRKTGEPYQTILSGFEYFPASTSWLPPLSFRKSGRVVGAGVSPFAASIYQPCFDSYTDAFEHDGFKQSFISPNGTIFTDGKDFVEATSVSLNPAITDLASNGLDDDSNGLIDDYSEQDSSPPVLAAMPSIQALIRLEDVGASVIQQIAVTQDLVTQ